MIQVIGIDCATKDKKIGVARGLLDGQVTRIEEVCVCSEERSAVDQVAMFIEDAVHSVLLAIDSPLGWPVLLGSSLALHKAGDELLNQPNDLFRRTTDRFIQEKLKKTPLDIGADRIARTAHSALRLLGDLRRRFGATIPIAWSPTFAEPIAAIEVYPAATLIGRGLRSSGYKGKANISERREILHHLPELHVDGNRVLLENNADALDAALCLVAGTDFLLGLSAPPTDVNSAIREGWIWARIGGSSDDKYPESVTLVDR